MYEVAQELIVKRFALTSIEWLLGTVRLQTRYSATISILCQIRRLFPAPTMDTILLPAFHAT